MDENTILGEDSPVTSLESLVRLGTATETDLGMQMRAIMVGVSTAACNIVERLHNQSMACANIMQRLSDKHLEKLSEEIETMDRTELDIEYKNLMDRQIAVAKLEIKIAQGKAMFPEDSFSEEDRKILRMLSALRSKEDRQRFVRILSEEFGDENSFDNEPVVPSEPIYDDVNPAASESTRGGRVRRASRKISAGREMTQDEFAEMETTVISKGPAEDMDVAVAAPDSSVGVPQHAIEPTPTSGNEVGPESLADAPSDVKLPEPPEIPGFELPAESSVPAPAAQPVQAIPDFEDEFAGM